MRSTRSRPGATEQRQQQAAPDFRREVRPIPASGRRSDRSDVRNTKVRLGARRRCGPMNLDGLFDQSRRVPRLAGRGLVNVYRYTLSPLVGYHCRHLPTCSEYADEALERYGLWAGGWMTLARILRCHPWGTSGIDRVPEMAPPGAHWYTPWRFARWSWVQRTD